MQGFFWLGYDRLFKDQQAFRKKKERDISVTVCVAAICARGLIFGASDRMLTSGDVQFEPMQPKIMPLTSSIAVMIAGDSGTQIEIIENIEEDVRRHLEATPDVWLRVKYVADLYADYYKALRLRRAEGAILAPLGLNNKTFIAEQQNMDTNLVSQLATELINFNGPDVEALFVGVDLTGSHIYMAQNSYITCRDDVGFAAIGAGFWHANSQFMFAGHTKEKPEPETLLLTYRAKKRAEVAPGVGEATDMFILGPKLGSYVSIREDIVNSLDKIYRKALKRERDGAQKANLEVNKYVEDLSASAVVKEEQKITPEDEVGNISPDKKERSREEIQEK